MLHHSRSDRGVERVIGCVSIDLLATSDAWTGAQAQLDLPSASHRIRDRTYAVIGKAAASME